MAYPADPLDIRSEDDVEEAEHVTARQELEEIAEILREADEAEKAAKSLKDDVKGPFFELISEVVRDEIALAREVVTVEIDPDDAFDSEAWRKLNYPLHNIVAIQPEADDDGPATRMVITIEESDQLKKFEFTVNGFKFGRTVRFEGKGFDAEEFWDALKKRRYPKELKEQLLATVSKTLVPVFAFDEAKALKLMAENPETVAIFQEFINPGTPKVALLPIKALKEEE